MVHEGRTHRLDEGAIASHLLASVGVDPYRALARFREVSNRLAELRKEEGELRAALAAYDGQFGRGGHWEHERKAILAAIKVRYMDQARDAGEKMSNADADDHAHADPEYVSWLDKKRVERGYMDGIVAQLAVTRARIEEALLDKELIDREIRLNEEIVRLARAEMRLS